MSSSTSDSKKALVFLAAIIVPLLMAEAVLRAVEPRLSLDVRYALAMPEIAKKLHEGDRPSVLFLGNSIVRRGIDADLVQTKLSERLGRAVNVASAHIDATTIAEWPYILDHVFLRRSAAPDVVILGVSSHILDDETAIRPDLIGGYFSDWGDTRDIFSRDLLTASQRAEYLLAHVSVAYRTRRTVQKRVLRKVVRNYEPFAQELNRMMQHPGGAGAPAASSSPRSFSRLQRFVTIARAHSVEVILIVFPRQPPVRHEFDPDEKNALEQLHVATIDMRDLDWIAPEFFMDTSHFSEPGGRLFAEALIEPLASAITRLKPAQFSE